MDSPPVDRLQILVADGREELRKQVIATLGALGHLAIEEAALDRVGPVTAATKPDAAIVVVGESSDNALAMIGKIVHEAACPVIAILDVEDPHFVDEAAKRGIFAYITEGQGAAELQSAIDIVLRRFAEYHALEGAFARRAVTERAKGILMERHSINERDAFNALRREARRTNRKLTEIAEAVVASHQLLPASPAPGRPGANRDAEWSVRSGEGEEPTPLS
jgi:AmiR/NasT family two-component response regulator